MEQIRAQLRDVKAHFFGIPIGIAVQLLDHDVQVLTRVKGQDRIKYRVFIVVIIVVILLSACEPLLEIQPPLSPVLPESQLQCLTCLFVRVVMTLLKVFWRCSLRLRCMLMYRP